MGETSYPETYAWACAWSNGRPHPFIMAHTLRSNRKDAIGAFVQMWAIDKAPVMRAWREAYREGARCIRVSVRPWGFPAAQRASKEGKDGV